MKVLIAPQAFKGTLSPIQVALAIDRGVKKANPKIMTTIAPQADGGDGSLEVILNVCKGTIKHIFAENALGKKRDIIYGVLQDGTAVIETALICGVSQLPSNLRNPAVTTSYGVGAVILDAINNGTRNFIICLGGTATNDGGAGMLQALDVRFLDNKSNEIPFGGLALAKLHKIDASSLDPRVKESCFTILSDVKNPLLGKHGASVVYSPQKGADVEMVESLEHAMHNYAHVIKADWGVDVSLLPHLGSGGGLAAAFYSLLNGRVISGSEWFLKKSHMEKLVKEADIVITGEGKLDGQTVHEKGVLGVAKLCKDFNKPLIAIVGSMGFGYEELYSRGISAILPLSFVPIPSGHEPPNSAELISLAAEQAIRLRAKS